MSLLFLVFMKGFFPFRDGPLREGEGAWTEMKPSGQRGHMSATPRELTSFAWREILRIRERWT